VLALVARGLFRDSLGTGFEAGIALSDGAEPSDGFRRVLVSSETEIKFAVEKSRKPTVVEGMSEGTRQPSAYETIYFDTDDFDLRRHRSNCACGTGMAKSSKESRPARTTATSSDSSRTRSF
jgi:hypothetical protein